MESEIEELGTEDLTEALIEPLLVRLMFRAISMV